MVVRVTNALTVMRECSDIAEPFLYWAYAESQWKNVQQTSVIVLLYDSFAHFWQILTKRVF